MLRRMILSVLFLWCAVAQALPS
ncbi:TPA: fimbrial protein, partial [Escherichia coli]|nr:fimbrial protein [Escherichia coli]